MAHVLHVANALEVLPTKHHVALDMLQREHQAIIDLRTDVSAWQSNPNDAACQTAVADRLSSMFADTTAAIHWLYPLLPAPMQPLPEVPTDPGAERQAVIAMPDPAVSEPQKSEADLEAARRHAASFRHDGGTG